MGKYILISVLSVLALVGPSVAFLQKIYNPSTELANSNLHKFVAGQDDEPLFLTPYIEQGKLDEARNLSLVRNLPGLSSSESVKSYSGYLTVNKKYNSNIFFWLFPPMNGKVTKETPILLWLQGGPGASSMYALFVENGPLVVSKDMKHLSLRNYSWNHEFAMVYVDQPVGTGFSFTDNDAGYAKNQNDVARDLFEALKQLFTLYNEYHGNPFFVTGESYAGKYVPAITHKIHVENEEAKKHGINLAGMAIGDGLCDPISMFDYGDLLYQMGLLDGPQREFFLGEQERARSFIRERKFEKAFRVFDELLNGDLTPNGFSYYRNWTGLQNYFNILVDNSPEDNNYYNGYLALKETRTAIHVGNRQYNNGTTVESHLVNDVMDSVRPWVEDILDANIRSLFYSGQLDVIVGAPLTENFLRQVVWKHRHEYVHAKRYIYKVDPKDSVVAGYVRHAGNLIYALIRNAGHMVPYDQPRVAYDMIHRFVKQKALP